MAEYSELANGELVERFSNIVGSGNVVTGEAELQPYLTELRGLFVGRSTCVLKPGTTGEVSKILQIANTEKLPIIPQGGNTGLVGGQTPVEDDMVVLSLERMDSIRNMDTDGNVMTVEAGVILENIHQVAMEADRMFPLSLSSQGSCCIGGNISTNAGGTAVLAYGNTRDLVLGLEVVLANGVVWNGLRSLRKDNTGYDLKQLFIGSEGTLGIITAANIRIFPRPNSQDVAYFGVDSSWKALELLNLSQSKAGFMLTGFELIPRIAMEFSLRHLPDARDPLSTPHDWYVLMEISSGGEVENTRIILESIFTDAMKQGIVADAVLAESMGQCNSFWKLRHGLSEVQRHEGGSIKHDVSVPVAKVPEFLDRAVEAVTALIPGCRPFAFGHMGDGNIHFNVSQPENGDKSEFLSKWGDVNKVVHGIVVELDGSVSAEHGIGRLKRNLMKETKSEVELNMMRNIKNAFDPNGILNPGCVL